MDEIEVTPQMIKAGVAVYEGWTDKYERTLYMEGVVREIYRAMRALEPYPSHEFYTDRMGAGRCSVCGMPEDGLASKVYVPCPGPIKAPEVEAIVRRAFVDQEIGDGS